MFAGAWGRVTDESLKASLPGILS